MGILMFLALALVAMLIAMAFLWYARAFLNTHKDVLGLMVSIIGGLLTFAGLIFAGIQIQIGARQVEASTVYQLQKDGRELFEKAHDDQDYYTYVLKPILDQAGDPLSPENKVRFRVAEIFQYFDSIFALRKYGTLQDDNWNSVRLDLCGYVALPIVEEIWNKHYAKLYTDGFAEEVTKCATPAQ